MLRLPNIQILRAVAAIAVVFYHDGIETTNICTATGQACAPDFWIGAFGVPLFFIISGFIMVTTSWNNFGVAGAPLDFMKRRIIRIVPLYWLVTTIAIVGILMSPDMLKVAVVDPLYFLASYLFWPMARVNGLVRPIANLGWTLNLEMMFYAVFTVALFFGRKRGLILAIGFLAFMSALQAIGLFAAKSPFHSVPLNFWADPIILNFIMGMLVAVIYRQGFRISSTESYLLIAISVVGVLLVRNFLGVLDMMPEDHIINRLVAMVPMLALFMAGSLGPQVESEKPLWRAGLLLGDASYSLYLIHPFILRPASKIWGKVIGTHLPAWTFTILAVFAALAGGLLVYVLIERNLTKFFSKKRLVAPGAQPLGVVEQGRNNLGSEKARLETRQSIIPTTTSGATSFSRNNR
ncbi:MAG: acyltransferase [Alphaproteobacteria bacterium]|nr:acyltransferase [Alphaproteobacteria bacterium]